MDNGAKKTYGLYALPLTADNIAKAAEERFARATASPMPGYVLVYTDGEQPPDSVQIGEDKADMLTDEDLRWLMASRTAIIAETLEEHAAELLGSLSNTVEKLETELKRKKQELDTEGE